MQGMSRRKVSVQWSAAMNKKWPSSRREIGYYVTGHLLHVVFLGSIYTGFHVFLLPKGGRGLLSSVFWRSNTTVRILGVGIRSASACPAPPRIVPPACFAPPPSPAVPRSALPRSAPPWDVRVLDSTDKQFLKRIPFGYRLLFARSL